MAPDGAMVDNIQEIKGIRSRRPIDRKRGPIDGRILILLAYGDLLMPETQIKLEAVRQELKDFVRQQ